MPTTEIKCPYCGAKLQVSDRAKAEGSQKIVCDTCKKPIALYRTQAEALQHRDRRVKAVSIEGATFSVRGTYLEFIETEFTRPQELQVPVGRSLLGRFNPQSRAVLQVLTADPSMDRQHSYLMLNKKGVLEVMDNDSMTGTFVNGEEIAPHERRRLRDGDVLTFGATTAIIHLESGEEMEELLY